MRRHSHAPAEPPSSPYGSAGEYVAWRAVLDAFKNDDLTAAYDEATDLGAGTLGHGLTVFRMIEAEWFTRSIASSRSIGRDLTLETVDREIGDPELLKRAIHLALDQTCSDLELARNRPLWVTILAEAANTPWTPGRHGFCAAKTGFAKVCLPFELLGDPSEFHAALKHEFSHALSQEAASGLCPMWLDEAVAMVVGGGLSPNAERLFKSGGAPWLPEGRLDAAFQADRESETGRRAVTAAYLQSGVIGRHLESQGGKASLGRLLKAHSAGVLDRLTALVRGERPWDMALRKVYGLSARALFDGARSSL